MRRFLPKFLGCFLVFGGLLAYYYFAVMPSLSGEFGILGQIPFGKEYEGLSIDYYKREPLDLASVQDVYVKDSLAFYDYLSIGDSFSQYGPDGYQWRLSHLLSSPIGNIKDESDSNPIQVFVTYANSGLFTHGQTIILECVERHLIERLGQLDFNATIDSESSTVQYKDESDLSLLNMFFSWIRLSFGFDSPVGEFTLSKDLFTHPEYSKTLFVYNSKKTGNGDLLWSKDDCDYQKAMEVLRELIRFAEDKGVYLVFLVATDKYDAYEPWIDNESHPINPTLSYLPEESFIVNTKPYLQQLINNGQKDVYKVNNTHWSVIGADCISDLLFSVVSNRDSI